MAIAKGYPTHIFTRALPSVSSDCCERPILGLSFRSYKFEDHFHYIISLVSFFLTMIIVFDMTLLCLQKCLANLLLSRFLDAGVQSSVAVLRAHFSCKQFWQTNVKRSKLTTGMYAQPDNY